MRIGRKDCLRPVTKPCGDDVNRNARRECKLRSLERKQLIASRVDAEGIDHPVVLQGDTREGWRARDYVRDLLRP